MYHQIVQTRPTQPSADDVVKQLNEPVFTALQFQRALEILAELPDSMQHDPRAQGLALQAFASDVIGMDEPIVSAALHARIDALARWTATHGPHRQRNAESVTEAAARFAISELDDGIGFEAAGFQELILFIEELPW